MVKKSSFLTFGVLLGLAGLLGACDPALEPPVREPYPYQALSPLPPPEPLAETQPQSAEPMREVWRKGHWAYDGLDFKWEAGAYILRPHPTAVWSPDRWERRAFGWAYISGFWQ